MQTMIDSYCKNVIAPIEAERNNLIKKVYSKNIIDIFSRKENKELLKKYDELWFSLLEKLEKMLED